jgi:hypothetical protein
LVAASEVLVGVVRPVIVAPVMVPPVIVAVDVNAPEIVAALIIGAVSVLLAKVCAPPVPTISPVTPC